MRQNPPNGGEGVARAGIVLGWVGVGLAVLIGVVILAAVLFFVPVRSAIGISQGIVVPLVLIPS